MSKAISEKLFRKTPTVPKNLLFYKTELDYKIALIENRIIEEYMRHNGKIFISWSGGKDSQVLMHIALRLFPFLPVVYSNTTNEMKEILDHIKKYPNVITVFPNKNFKQVIKTEGFPLVSKEVSQKVHELKNTNGYKLRMLRAYGNNKGDSKLPDAWHFLAEQEFDISAKCCEILKKRPLQQWAKANGNPLPLIALMKDESRLRQQLALYGKEDDKKIYPFLRTGWTEKDIWDYAEKHNIRFAECYYDKIINGKLIKAVKRSGCDVCTYGGIKERETKFARSQAVSPKKFEVMMKQTNNGVMFKNAIKIADKQIKNIYLGLFGGIVRDIEFNKYTNSEGYIFDIVSDAYECPCCNKRGDKTKTKFTKCELITSFKDTPNPENGRKRVIECHHYFYTCNNCGMTLNNNLHLFDLKFKVTKRAIDYIYNNMKTKELYEIAEDIGMNYFDVIEIVDFDYAKAFKEAKEYNYPSIWFDNKNKSIKAS